MTEFDDYLARKSAWRETGAALKAEGKAVLTNALKEFMEKNPVVTSISWVQYSPYFNDGDACTFYAHTDSVQLNGFDDYGTIYEGGSETDYIGDEDNDPALSEDFARFQVLKPLFDDVNVILSTFDESDYESYFGNHAYVTVTPQGTRIEEYRHD